MPDVDHAFAPAISAGAQPVIEPQVDLALARYYAMLSGYWPERFHYVDERYRTLPFPFAEVAPPAFEMEAEWDLDQLLGFIDTWTATRKYEEAHSVHPAESIWAELSDAWGAPERRRRVGWPV